jgi:hypothetical protein
VHFYLEQDWRSNPPYVEKMEANTQPVIIEEKIVKYNGEVQVRKYLKGKFLGKGGFAKCYEFQN